MMLLVSGVSAIVILVVAYRSHTAEHAEAPPAVRIESGTLQAAGQNHHAGSEWFGALPASQAEERPDAPPLGERIAALTATRDPADALKAYQIIEGCEAERPVFDLDPMPAVFMRRKKQCATITEAMRRSRYDYLRAAAYAGAPGVGSAWARYGPSGDPEALRARPNDPSIIEWKRQATALVVRDADRGDFNALQDLMVGYAGKGTMFDADPSRALAYAWAYKDVVDLLELGPLQNQPTDAELQALAAKLSPEQVAWAKAKAAEIVAARRKRISFTPPTR